MPTNPLYKLDDPFHTYDITDVRDRITQTIHGNQPPSNEDMTLLFDLSLLNNVARVNVSRRDGYFANFALWLSNWRPYLTDAYLRQRALEIAPIPEVPNQQECSELSVENRVPGGPTLFVFESPEPVTDALPVPDISKLSTEPQPIRPPRFDRRTGREYIPASPSDSVEDATLVTIDGRQWVKQVTPFNIQTRIVDGKGIAVVSGGIYWARS